MILRITLILFTFMVFSCGKDDGEGGSKIEAVEIASLDGAAEKISGEITFWMLEGDAGCYGEIRIGKNLFELWSEADLCENENIVEGSTQTLTVRLESEKQSYLAVAGKPVYSIIEFK